MGMGMRQRAEILTGVHLPIPTQGCRKMETWMRYSPQTQIETSEGNTMELTTDEIIAKLMNYTVKLDGEMRFAESDLVLEAVAYMHSMSKMAEVIRHANYTETRSQLNNVVRFITGTDNE